MSITADREQSIVDGVPTGLFIGGEWVDGDGTIDVEGRAIKVGVNPQLLSAAEAGIPLGRAGTPAEAAGAVYLLCIPESDYVSAQTLVCGGGFNL